MNTIKTDKKIAAYGPGNMAGAMSLKEASNLTSIHKFNRHITNLIDNRMC